MSIRGCGKKMLVAGILISQVANWSQWPDWPMRDGHVQATADCMTDSCLDWRQMRWERMLDEAAGNQDHRYDHLDHHEEAPE